MHKTYTEQWKVTVADTGLNTMTGGRIKRIKKYLDDEPFLLTYGDGLSDVDLDALVAFHNSHGKLATITAVHPDARFGVLEMSKNQITAFREKSKRNERLSQKKLRFAMYKPKKICYTIQKT